MTGTTKTNWRDYLTGHERLLVERADKAKAEWLKLQPKRREIAVRAANRAQHYSRKKKAVA